MEKDLFQNVTLTLCNCDCYFWFVGKTDFKMIEPTRVVLKIEHNFQLEMGYFSFNMHIFYCENACMYKKRKKKREKRKKLMFEK